MTFFKKDLFGTFLGNWISILDSDTLDSFGFLDSHGFLRFFACFGDFRHRVTQPRVVRVASHGPSPISEQENIVSSGASRFPVRHFRDQNDPHPQLGMRDAGSIQ